MSALSSIKTVLLPLSVSAGLLALVAANAPGAEAAGPAGSLVHLKRIGETAETLGREFFSQNELDLKADDTYTLTFWAKSPQGLSLKLSGKMSKPPWGAVGTPQTVDLSQNWQKYELTFEPKGAVPGHTRLAFYFGSPAPGDVWIADVRLRDSASDESSPENLISNGRFEEGLLKWYSEGQKADEFQIEVQSLAEAKN